MKYILTVVALFIYLGVISAAKLPIVINTWPFTNATQAAWKAVLIFYFNRYQAETVD